jgi:hypothetical protein
MTGATFNGLVRLTLDQMFGVGLRIRSFDHAQCFGHLVGAGLWLVLTEVRHSLPQITRAAPAVGDIAFDVGLERLYVVEDHGKRDKTCCHCDSAQSSGDESDQTKLL